MIKFIPKRHHAISKKLGKIRSIMVDSCKYMQNVKNILELFPNIDGHLVCKKMVYEKMYSFNTNLQRFTVLL